MWKLIFKYLWCLIGVFYCLAFTSSCKIAAKDQKVIELTHAEVVVGNAPALLISNVKKGDINSSRFVEFSVELSSRPKSIVTVPVGSSNSYAVPNKSEIKFTPTDWNVSQLIYIDVKGPEGYRHFATNPLIRYNSLKRFYLIFLGKNPGMLNPEEYAASEGVLSQVIVYSPELYFTPGINSPEVIFPSRDGIKVLSGPEGMEIKHGFELEWSPPDSAQGKTFNVEMEGVSDDDAIIKYFVSIKVLEGNEVEGVTTDNKFMVTDRSSLNGLIFEPEEGLSPEFRLREYQLDGLPPVPDGAKLVTAGFFPGVFGRVDVSIPAEKVSSIRTLSRVSYYGLEETIWLNSTRDWEFIQVDGQRFLKLTIDPHDIGVFAVDPPY